MRDDTSKAGAELSPKRGEASGGTLLEVRDLSVQFHLTEGTISAVDGIDFTIDPTTTLGFMGESGCGKSVTARAIVGIVPQPPGEVKGIINFYPEKTHQAIDLARLDPKGKPYRSIRGDSISMIFQEPMSALSPVHKVGDQISEVLRLHRGLNQRDAREQTIAMLDSVGISEPARRVHQYPFEMSGGMCQRVMIAMALCCRPRLLIADEPSTGLDVTIQAQILDLMKEIQNDYSTAVLFITHDLGVIAEMASEVAVMYMGWIVEKGSAHEVFYRHLHPYTEGLLRSIPTVSSQRHRLNPIKGSVPNPFSQIKGCKFKYRCQRLIGKRCEEVPPVFEVQPGHLARCWLYEKEGQQLTDGDGRQ